MTAPATRLRRTAAASVLAALLLTPPAFPEEITPQKQQVVVTSDDLIPLSNALLLLRLVDLRDRDPRNFLYAALAGTIESLDRYSQFVPPDMLSLFLDSPGDEYVGIGIHLVRATDRNAEVISVDDGSPAARAGIAPKDIITSLNGTPLATMSSVDISRRLRGKEEELGKEVRLLLRRAGGRDERELVLTRERIKIKTIEARLLRDGVGYVRIHRFRSNTPAELSRLITELRRSGPLKGVVLDLRNNPGGEMIASVDVVRLFISEGVVGSIESNYPGMNALFTASEPATVTEPLAVLIDEGSASGAELVAGAIKCHKRGTLVGRRTYGKGTFQSFVPLTDEMGAYLTLGRFRLPDGMSPEGVGVTPDITVSDDEAISRALRLLTEK